MVNWKSKKLGDGLVLANVIVGVVLINLLASFYFLRLDITEERRYSIKPSTQALLNSLEEPVYIEVFLEGDLNAGFKRFQKAIRETLEEFRVYSRGNVRYTFTNPSQAIGQKAQTEFMSELAGKGIQVLPVIETKDGQRTEKLVFPGALVSYGGFEKGVMLFKGNRAQGSQQVLNQAIEGIEYELARAIQILTNESRKTIAITYGHGELDSLALASLSSAMQEQYEMVRTDLSQPVKADVLLMAKPTQSFQEREKFYLDQFLLQGGRAIVLLDRLDARMDSSSSNTNYAFPYELGLDDQLFKYGVRINMNLVQDRVSGQYPVVVATAGNKPQVMRMDWPFFPLVNQFANHPITRNSDGVLLRFASSIDTVKAPKVKKTPLMFSSPYARVLNTPVRVSINDLRDNVSPEAFTGGPFVFAYLLEGEFSSVFANRFLPEGVPTQNFRETGKSKLIVVSDGDLARNELNPRTKQPMQLGLDPYTEYTFANQDLLLNMIAYLAEENGVINARTREIKLRPLDKEKIRDNRAYWQAINLALPLMVLIMFGVARHYWRQHKYTRA